MIEAMLITRPRLSAIMPRTTYLLIRIGESVLRRISASISVSAYWRAALGSQAGVVDEPVDRPEPRSRLAHERRDGGDVGEVERGEAERARGGVRRRSLQRLAVATRDRDDMKTVARQPFGDGEAEAAAGAGDDHIIHGARAFRFGHRQFGDETHARRRHVGGQSRAADAMISRSSPLATHAVEKYDSATTIAPVIGLPREDTACTDRRLRVEHRLDLLRMDLGAADVDDAAAPTEKEQRSPRISIMSPVSTNPSSSASAGAPAPRNRKPRDPSAAARRRRRPHRHGAFVFEPGRWEAGVAVGDGKADARLGRGVGVLDARSGNCARKASSTASSAISPDSRTYSGSMRSAAVLISALG